MSITEVSDYLGVPVSSLYSWHSEGTGPRVHKLGRHLRYRFADIETWLDGQVDQRTSASDAVKTTGKRLTRARAK